VGSGAEAPPQAEVREEDGDDAMNFELMEALQVIERARTVFTWGPAPKPGRPQSKQKKKAASR
jgi:hypothetical protein